MLSYTSNLLPARTLDDLLGRTLPFFERVRRRLGWPRLGLDLHLNGPLLRRLRDDATAAADLRRAFDGAGLAVETINAFPLGDFQGTPVKERVYEPDWTQAERLDDTLAAIAVASRLSDERMVTVSTLAGSFKPWGPQRNDRRAIAANLGRWAAAACRAARDGAPQVVLCLEPEPLCTLETVDECIAFARDDLAGAGLDAAAAGLDGDRAAARQALATHLALCLDTCHLSAEFEGADGISRCAAAGLRPAKVQVSACLAVDGPQGDLTALAALDEPRFLHQVLRRDGDGRLTRFADLGAPGALAPLAAGEALRCHFHVPLHRDPPPPLRSTASESLAFLAAAQRQATPQVAVETYTWSVLARDGGDLEAGVAGELAWLAERIR